MKKLALTAALGAACLGLAACGDNRRDDANMADANGTAAAGEDNGTAATGGDGSAAAGGTAAAGSTSFPKGARIVEEDGATWRIDADGTRVRLGDRDSRIVVENGVRYRVDPGGARVRINERGLDIDVPDLTPDLGPDVDVGINKKGNPDIDIKDKKDGNDGPN
ncbi:MAG TPA: hypothetical protein VK403_10840 [Allosphingosinicella sp.]|nr:hypothetical protein [Allosphingosinicella sp.]